jgi:hypothetical protein
VTIPIRLLNRSTEIWGENANEFRFVQVFLSYICSFDGRRVVGPSDGKMYQKL